MSCISRNINELNNDEKQLYEWAKKNKLKEHEIEQLLISDQLYGEFNENDEVSRI